MQSGPRMLRYRSGMSDAGMSMLVPSALMPVPSHVYTMNDLCREMVRGVRGTTASPAPATWMSAALPPTQGESMQNQAIGPVKQSKNKFFP
jgi:hypothetical protein